MVWLDFQSKKSFGKLRLRPFQPYHPMLCMLKGSKVILTFDPFDMLQHTWYGWKGLSQLSKTFFGLKIGWILRKLWVKMWWALTGYFGGVRGHFIQSTLSTLLTWVRWVIFLCIQCCLKATNTTFDPFDMSKMSNISLYTVLSKSHKHYFWPFWH